MRLASRHQAHGTRRAQRASGLVSYPLRDGRLSENSAVVMRP